MEYLIDKAVVYRTDDGVLWTMGNESETVTLSPTANRLLNVIIEGREKPMRRQELLTKVWDEHGLVSSGNSLNQYLCQLRKVLAAFGLSEHAIETIPKVGIIFSQDISVSVHYTDKNNVPENHWFKYRYLLFIVIMIINIGLVYFAMTAHQGVRVRNPDHIGFIDECPVYALNKNFPMTNETLVELASTFMTQNAAQCKKGKVIYFHGDNKLFADGMGNAFLSLCVMKNDRLLRCANYLTMDWSVDS